MSYKILLLEDDSLFAETIEDFLQEEGFEVRVVLDPLSALELTYSYKFDLYLMDANLPFESGFDLLGKLRESGDMTPAIFLTSREDKDSLREGFMAGADDYLCKPVDLDELLLRMHAVLRRQSRQEVVNIGEYSISLENKSISKGAQMIEVSSMSVKLLLLLLRAHGEVVPTDIIKDHLWPASKSSSDGALRVYVTQLKKLFPKAIQNTRGVGYLLDQTKV